MKYLDPKTKVNTPEDIYQLFTRTFPELIPSVVIWFPQGEYTEKNRKIDIWFDDGMRFRFGVERDMEDEGWFQGVVYMIPAYMQEEDIDNLFKCPPATGVELVNSVDEMAELFYNIYPNYRDKVVTVKRYLNSEFIKGIELHLTDGKVVSFNVTNWEDRWDAGYAFITPRPDKKKYPRGECEEIGSSDLTIFLL